MIMSDMNAAMFDCYTDAEVEFIKTIGSHSVGGQRTERQYLLSGYLSGCEQRTNWDDLDRSRIMAAAKSELQHENAMMK